MAAVSAVAAERAPVCASTPGFHLCTVDGERAARDAVLHLEKVKAFFEAAGGPLRVPAEPVRVVAFSSEEEYRAWSTLNFASAHFQAKGDEGYIVLPDPRASSYAAAVHELVHVYTRAAGARFPPWLEEGLAEFYSTLRPAGDGALVVGEPPPGRVQTLAGRPVIGMDAMLAAERGSPFLTELEPGRAFYAQSWALTHMLAASARYRDGFPRFLALAAGGSPIEAASKEAFGRSVAEVRGDLEEYLRRGRFESKVVRVGGSDAPPVVRSLSEYEWAATLAGLRASGREGWEGARSAYQELAEAFPDRPEPLVTLARRALATGRVQEARAAFAAAIERGSRDASVLLEYADLLAGEAPGAERLRLLRRAAELAPGDGEVRRRLALALYESLEYEEARRWMLTIEDVAPRHAAEYFRVLAYLNERLGLDEEARTAASRAVAAATNAEEADYGRALLELVTRPSPQAPPREAELAAPVPEAGPAPSRVAAVPEPAVVPPKPSGPPLYPLQGELIQVDCYGRAAVVWVRTAKEKAGFEVADTQRLVLKRGGEPVLRYFTCGPQRPESVIVRFEARRNPVYGTRGIARSIEFPPPPMR